MRMSLMAVVVSLGVICTLMVAGMVTASFQSQSYAATTNYNTRWQQGARAAPGTDLCFHAALKHNAAAALDAKFWRVSMPDSKEYGQHLTMDQVTKLMAIPQQSIDSVVNWFKSVPTTSVSATANGDMVHACMPATSAEQLMGTQFNLFAHATSAHSGYRASSSLTVPSHISSLVDFIGGANTPIHRFTPQVKSAMDHTRASAGAAVNAPAGPLQHADTPSMRQVPKEDPESKIAPRLTQVIGGFQEIAVHFVALCSDGSPNADLEMPCSSHPPYVDSFELLVSTEGHGERVLTVPPSACSGPNCVITVDQVRNYQSITARVNTKFADGSYSGFSRRSYVVYATDYATPQFLKNLYGIPTELRVKNKASTQSVAEFLEQYYSTADLDMYLTDMGIERQNVARLIGPNNETEGSLTGGESQLDIQVMMGVAPGADTWFWSVAGRQHHTHQEPFLHWLMQVANTSDAPLVHSVSYADDELSYEPWYIQRMDLEFQKMGLRGMTVLVASGDDGIGTGDSRPAPGSTTRTDCEKSHPGYPSSSPYVLSIGGTQLTDSGSPVCLRSTHGLKMTCSNLREKGCSSHSGGVITSGGGFSNIFTRPSYQDEAISKYLSAADVKLPPAHFFNRSGRGYPDISAYSSNYITIMNREISLSSGTSASTPLIAAMITFWNDLLITSGMPPVGFFNPRLYQIASEHPEAFNDVVIGDNKCGIYGVDCCPYGFEAHSGWDPITGLGTPRFNEITTILLAPRNPFPWVSGIDANNLPQVAGNSSTTFLTIIATLALLLSGFAVYKVTKLGNDDHHDHGHSHGAEKDRLLPKYGSGDSR